MFLNKVFLYGNLTRDPELRTTPSGQPVCTFGIATNRRYKDASGQMQDQAEFHTLVAWGRQGEVIAQYMKRGSSMMIEGRLQTRNWTDQQNVKHYRTEIVVEEFQFGPRPAGVGGGGDSGGDRPPRRDFNNDRGDNASNQPRRNNASADHDQQQSHPEEPPIIELPDDGEEIDVKDIPF